VLGWDVWNEPSNTNEGSYEKEEATNKKELVEALLPKVFSWARAAGATQPLTSAVWEGDWSEPEKLGAMTKIQLELSDVISFHNYDKPAEFEKRVKWLQTYHRPILCTEYMARGMGARSRDSAAGEKISCGGVQLGLVAGKTQTYFPWIPGRSRTRITRRAVAPRHLSDGWDALQCAGDGIPEDDSERPVSDGLSGVLQRELRALASIGREPKPPLLRGRQVRQAWAHLNSTRG